MKRECLLFPQMDICHSSTTSPLWNFYQRREGTKTLLGRARNASQEPVRIHSNVEILKGGGGLWEKPGPACWLGTVVTVTCRKNNRVYPSQLHTAPREGNGPHDSLKIRRNWCGVRWHCVPHRNALSIMDPRRLFIHWEARVKLSLSLNKPSQ